MTVLSKDGRVLLKLKQGKVARFTVGGRAHAFAPSGLRLDAFGDPAAARARSHFIALEWTAPAPPPSATPPLDAVLRIASRSEAFTRALADAYRAGWVVQLAARHETPGVFRGPHVIDLDPEPGSALAARLVHQVALANALTAPLPAVDPADDGFARDNAVWFLKGDGAARLVAAIAREEIVHGGGPDIGGPGLRGEQLRVFAAFRRGLVSKKRAADLIGLSCDSVEARGFTSKEGPRIARNFAAAFTPPLVRYGDPLARNVLDILGRLTRMQPLAAPVIARELGVKLVEASANADYASHEGWLPPPFGAIRLHAPIGRGATRVVVSFLAGPTTPTYAAFASAFALGSPHHVDSSESPCATVAYALPAARAYATFALQTGALRYVAVTADTREGCP